MSHVGNMAIYVQVLYLKKWRKHLPNMDLFVWLLACMLASTAMSVTKYIESVIIWIFSYLKANLHKTQALVSCPQTMAPLARDLYLLQSELINRLQACQELMPRLVLYLTRMSQ